MIEHPDAFQSWLPAQYDGVFAWDFLIPAFARQNQLSPIRPSDFDGVVERRGRSLIYETKTDASVPLPLGQRNALEAYMALRPGFITIVHVIGKTWQDVTQFTIWWYCHSVAGRELRRDPYTGDWRRLLEMSRQWFLAADSNRDYDPRKDYRPPDGDPIFDNALDEFLEKLDKHDNQP
ncbi:MAG: hypothetical protein JSV16_08640 [Candidatus Hydrogenedentota bacterium]|nr:MAG: hypothetical protein JSV16_08640 [Candidatus Hydrogenedentota bacterium]